MDKSQILKEFSADPDKYYNVKLFQEQGFVRKACSKCGRFFWTLNAGRELCPDDADEVEGDDVMYLNSRFIICSTEGPSDGSL